MFAKEKHLCYGSFLVLTYLICGMVGKSCLEGLWHGTWRVHQATGIMLSVALLGHLALRWHQEDHIHGLPLSDRVARSALFAFLGCVLATGLMQERVAPNAIASVTYVGMLLTLAIYPKVYFRNLAAGRVIDILCVVIFLGTSGCVIAVLTASGIAFGEGRLNGIYNNPITAARMLNLGCLLLLWRAARSRRYRKLALAGFMLTLIALVLTKTRTNIACVIVTSGTLMARMLCRNRISIGAAITILGIVLGLAFLLLPNIVDHNRLSDMRAFLRLDEDPQDLASNRMPYWEEGLGDVTSGRLLGEGYLAAFGGGSGGFQESAYDRESNRHNIFFSCAQSYGAIGCCLFCSFLFIALYKFMVRDTPLAALGVSVLLYTLITGTTGNCLLSFGDPADRFAWLLLGICWSCDRSERIIMETRQTTKKGNLALSYHGCWR